MEGGIGWTGEILFLNRQHFWETAEELGIALHRSSESQASNRHQQPTEGVGGIATSHVQLKDVLVHTYTGFYAVHGVSFRLMQTPRKNIDSFLAAPLMDRRF